jgi:hypothetical protein
MRTDRWTDMMKLIVAFRNLAKAPTKLSVKFVPHAVSLKTLRFSKHCIYDDGLQYAETCSLNRLSYGVTYVWILEKVYIYVLRITAIINNYYFPKHHNWLVVTDFLMS